MGRAEVLISTYSWPTHQKHSLHPVPAGPFLAYDRDGRLSATVYMTPLDDLQNGTSFDELNIGSHTVSSTDIYFNAGHPGVDKPHAHVVLFHDENAKDRLAE